MFINISKYYISYFDTYKTKLFVKKKWIEGVIMDKKIIMIISVLAVLAVFGIVKNNIGESPTGNAIKAGDINNNDYFRISLEDVTDEAAFYSQTVDGVEVKFFAVRASDGSIRTAFDACDVCHGAKKGYTQVGNEMRCNNCGLHFAIDTLGEKNKGSGCWPSHLNHEIINGEVVISKEDLKDKKYMF
ncbi:hypothetical protein BVX95_01685 [archaeon D22]|nr:hypothetical protein BVX95_01685 [archaeon D22]